MTGPIDSGGRGLSIYMTYYKREEDDNRKDGPRPKTCKKSKKHASKKGVGE